MTSPSSQSDGMDILARKWTLYLDPGHETTGRAWLSASVREGHQGDGETWGSEVVNVVPASELEGIAEERDKLRSALRAAVNDFVGWRDQAYEALGWTTDEPGGR